MSKIKELIVKMAQRIWEQIRYKSKKEVEAVKSIAELTEQLAAEKNKIKNLQSKLKRYADKEKTLGSLMTSDEIMYLMELGTEASPNAISKAICIAQNIYFKAVINTYISQSGFIKCTFNHITFTGVTFEDINFLNSVFERAHFIGCKFISCNFEGVIGYEMTFEECDYKDTDIKAIMHYKMQQVS